MKDEAQRPAVDPAFLVDRLLQQLQRLLLLLAEKRAAAGQRLDDMNVIRLLGKSRIYSAQQKQRQSADGQRSHLHKQPSLMRPPKLENAPPPGNLFRRHERASRRTFYP